MCCNMAAFPGDSTAEVFLFIEKEKEEQFIVKGNIVYWFK